MIKTHYKPSKKKRKGSGEEQRLSTSAHRSSSNGSLVEGDHQENGESGGHVLGIGVETLDLPPLISLAPSWRRAMADFQEHDDEEDGIRWYSHYFLGRSHMNFIGYDSEGRRAAVSIVQEKENKQYRAILRTSREEGHKIVKAKDVQVFFGLFPLSYSKLLKEIDPGLSPKNLIKIKAEPEQNVLTKELEDMEKLLLNSIKASKYFKFGVIYVKEGQTEEEEILSNQIGSEEFESFCTFLGDKIELVGWEKYNAGLDTKGLNGKHSIYTEWNNVEIMFHCLTYLPYVPNDKLQVERKAHIGNDVVLIAFVEGSTPYLTSTISSKQNHIIVVVQPYKHPKTESVHYRISVACKEGVPEFGPPIPQPAIFEANEAFRDLLFTKLTNGERAAAHAPEFFSRLSRQRESALKTLDEKVLELT